MSSEKIISILSKSFKFLGKICMWMYLYIINIVYPFIRDVVWGYLKKKAADLKKHKISKKQGYIPLLRLEKIVPAKKELPIEHRDIFIDNSKINAIDFDVKHNKNQYIRCAHNKNCNKNYHEVLNSHAKYLMSSSRNITLNVGTTPITINIPIIFHLTDSILKKNDTKYWTKHINTNIISSLNTDYNRTVTNFGNEYISQITKLFADADDTKKEYYLNLRNNLPKNENITWKFSLQNIIIKSLGGMSIDSANLDPIYKAVNVVDPESFLNIIVVPGKQLLGISTFPFVDRDDNDESLISSNYKYRNAILINTNMFLGNVAPYDKYRTFTHEIGHWCGLLHPFDNDTCKTSCVTKFGLGREDTGDLIADTTVQFNPTFGTVYDSVKTKRTNGIVTQVHSSPYAYIFNKNVQMPNFLNFMDYTDDAQMCMFTHLQILKMAYMMSRFRPKFVKY